MVFTSFLLFSEERIGKSIYSVTVNNPLLRELPLYLPRFISLNQQTSAINPHKKQRPLSVKRPQDICAVTFFDKQYSTHVRNYICTNIWTNITMASPILFLLSIKNQPTLCTALFCKEMVSEYTTT